MNADDLGFVHLFRAASDASAPTLLLLHGTGGTEEDLLPLARMLAADAAMLSPRGNVRENGMPRFFRRLAEGVFDLDDLRYRSAELAAFVDRAVDRYGLDAAKVVAVGFSNGANIAAALMLLHPHVLRAAILFRAMVPLVPDVPPSLSGTAVLISNGRTDPLIPAPDAERLAALLRAGGADVTLEWQTSGHQLTERDVRVARAWLAEQRQRLQAASTNP